MEAVIDVIPTLIAVAIPFDGLMVALLMSDECQLTEVVISRVVPSEKYPVAV